MYRNLTGKKVKTTHPPAPNATASFTRVREQVSFFVSSHVLLVIPKNGTHGDKMQRRALHLLSDMMTSFNSGKIFGLVLRQRVTTGADVLYGFIYECKTKAQSASLQAQVRCSHK